jgi:hypothetical protein
MFERKSVGFVVHKNITIFLFSRLRTCSFPKTLHWVTGLFTISSLYFQEGRTALHMAAENGHAEVADHLLMSMADPNAETLVNINTFNFR